ncbi:hypothetical protein [Rhizobium mesoamericanum]|uniref:Uncharacterized protein n=1 Tax=Rhizobium mesoamericanum STM3625 TaxID=1211777 RepID=K0PUE5_9HYPH|nr:hypothetical protein [Rhizobium mesoamericanum]CCM80356.1 exported hypothetical protein [Rhizobium mesoamericanum STM3625]
MKSKVCIPLAGIFATLSGGATRAGGLEAEVRLPSTVLERWASYNNEYIDVSVVTSRRKSAQRTLVALYCGS